MTSSGAQPRNWTSRSLLQWTGDYFRKKGLDSPRLAAEMLLSHVLGVERLKLFMDPDRPTSELERATFRDLVERAARHEPVDYLVGQSPFFSMQFEVTPAVLIPRPSTETLVEHVMQHSRRTPGFRQPHIVDVCTGSGAIAVALAKHMTDASLTATDLSTDALAVARRNAARHKVADRIHFLEGDLLTPLSGKRFHYLVSNPPYISDAEWDQVAPNVRDHEPHTALRGGADGLKYIRPLIAGCRQHLTAPGQLVLEIAASQRDAVLKLAAAAGLRHGHVLPDHEGLPRMLVADNE